MEDQQVASPRTFEPVHVVVLGCLLALALAALMVGLLHRNAIDPHSGLQNPQATGGSEPNLRAVQRSATFVDALSRGDVAKMKAMAEDASDKAQVEAFVAAFGNRPDHTESVDGGDFAISSTVTTIVVPCRDGSTQKAILVMQWKATSFFGSDWFAFLHPPGEKGVQPAGCPAP